jgi:hypothetical protein
MVKHMLAGEASIYYIILLTFRNRNAYTTQVKNPSYGVFANTRFV